jgi:hypothetical protein
VSPSTIPITLPSMISLLAVASGGLVDLLTEYFIEFPLETVDQITDLYQSEGTFIVFLS